VAVAAARRRNAAAPASTSSSSSAATTRRMPGTGEWGGDGDPKPCSFGLDRRPRGATTCLKAPRGPRPDPASSIPARRTAVRREAEQGPTASFASRSLSAVASRAKDGQSSELGGGGKLLGSDCRRKPGTNYHDPMGEGLRVLAVGHHVLRGVALLSHSLIRGI
jgi:hypothetical protein